jgi:hypothetical protein
VQVLVLVLVLVLVMVMVMVMVMGDYAGTFYWLGAHVDSPLTQQSATLHVALVKPDEYA